MNSKKSILYLGLDPQRYKHHGDLTHFPLIRTEARPFEKEIKNTFSHLVSYTHILFTSRVAVSIFFEYAQKIDYTHAKKNIICIGRATALKVKEKGMEATFVAEEETGEGVIELLKKIPLKNAFVLFPRSAQGRSLIPLFLQQKGIKHTIIDLYDTHPAASILPPLNSFDEIIFTSPSIVHTFFALKPTPFPHYETCIPIGPVTKKILDSYFI